MVYQFIPGIWIGNSRALVENGFRLIHFCVDLKTDFKIKASIWPRSHKAYESQDFEIELEIDPNASRDRGRVYRMYNQELRAAANDAAHQQDQ